jgi:hypothetical protein
MNISETLMAFWRRPLDIEGDAVNWILFLGFVIVVAFMWTRVLKTVID